MAEQSATSTRTTPEKKVRTPKPGDAIVFTGWTTDERALAGFAANCVGEKVSLSYMTKNGTWLSAHLAPYDATGQTAGSWRWPE